MHMTSRIRSDIVVCMSTCLGGCTYSQELIHLICPLQAILSTLEKYQPYRKRPNRDIFFKLGANKACLCQCVVQVLVHVVMVCVTCRAAQYSFAVFNRGRHPWKHD